jgi:hypothetical protein
VKHLAAASLAVASVAACDLPLPGQGTRTLPLYDGAVLARGPTGYCVDPASSRPEAGFAVIGACGLLAASGIMPPADGFITVQVAGPGTAAVSGAEEALARLLREPRGAALLTDSDTPAAVTVGQIDLGEGTVIVRFRDSADPPVAGLTDEGWRAFLDLEDRLATVNLRSYDRAPLPPAQARALLYAAVAALRAAN